MGIFDKIKHTFLGTSDTIPDVEIKQKCGVLLRSSESGHLWVIAPFKDADIRVFNPPKKKIEAIVVLNGIQEGSLPFFSLVKGIKKIPENVFFVNSKNRIEDLNTVPKSFVQKQLSSFQVGVLTITYHPETNFITK